jgi:hypothetical protein
MFPKQIIKSHKIMSSLTSGMKQLQNNSIDLKNVWIFSSPLAVNLSWERLELAILEASDLACDVVRTVCFVWSFPDANSYANAIAKSPQSTPPLCRLTEGTSISRASKLIAKLDLLIYRIISTNKTQKLNLISVVSWGDSIR